MSLINGPSFRASTWAFPIFVGLATAALLLPPLEAARALTLAGSQDSGTPGRRPPAQTARLSAFLRAQRHGARYEAATHGVGGVSALIVHDGLPVLFLSNLGRQPLVPLHRFIALIRAGQLRAVLVGACPPRSRSSACDPTGDWTRRHGRDVSVEVGLPPASLYLVGPPYAARQCRDRARIWRSPLSRPSSVSPSRLRRRCPPVPRAHVRPLRRNAQRA